MEAHRKVRYDMTLFSSVEDYYRYKQKFVKRKVVSGKSINFSQLQHFGFKGLFSRIGWLPVMTISEPIFPTLVRAFYSRVAYGLVDWSFPPLEVLRSGWSGRAFAAFSTSLQLDLGCMSPRLDPLCRVFSLERLLRGCAALETPRGWANHRHIAWPWSVESFITWSTPSYCHEVDIEMRSLILRHSS